MKKDLRALIVTAHPDDAESSCGGMILMLKEKGFSVKILVMTNGDAGCGNRSPEDAVLLRRGEAAAAAAFLGCDLEILPNHDGYLEPTMKNRETLVRRIREYHADILIGHPPFDYHPDHRAVSQLLTDAVFMTVVDGFCPDVPPLPDLPILLFHQDVGAAYRHFEGDYALDLAPWMQKKVKALSLHRSQMLLPDEYSMSENEVFPRIIGRTLEKNRLHAEMNRELLKRQYGEEKGSAVRFAEIYSISMHGRAISPELLLEIFL